MYVQRKKENEMQTIHSEILCIGINKLVQKACDQSKSSYG